MPDNNGEQYKAEIAMLSREIHRLNHQLEQTGRTKKINKYAPFDNPTDYPNFSGDYSVILPQLDSQNYSIPLEPSSSERKKLKRYYSIGGWCVILQFLFSNVLIQGLVLLISALLGSLNSDTGNRVIMSYIQSSSILAGITLLTYMTVNVTFGFMGLKLAKVRKLQLVRTKNFAFSQIIQYCIIGIAIWSFSAFASGCLNDVFSKYGYPIQSPDISNIGNTSTGFAVLTIYTCLIAPVTEEIFFRGMLLRVFSKANQRFAIFFSALFFGLCHGNIPQMILGFLLGIFLAHITLKHNSIIPSVIVHIFINISVTVLSFVTDSLSSEYMAVLETGMSAVGFIGLFMLIVFYSNDKIPSTTPAQSRRGIYVASGSIPFVIALLLETAYVVYNTIM